MVTLFVEDIQCGHCTMRIEKALKEANIEAEVTLEDKSVKVKNEDKDKVLELLDDIGYPGKEM